MLCSDGRSPFGAQERGQDEQGRGGAEECERRV
jgi:hypothetical protein